MIQENSEEHYTPSPSFSELLRYAAYGTDTPDPQDLRGVRDWRRELDRIAREMWFDAYMAGKMRGAEEMNRLLYGRIPHELKIDYAWMIKERD